MDDLQRTSETVVFMVYLGKWSGGGVVSSVDVLVVHESMVSNPDLRFCFFALIEQEEPSGGVIHVYLLEEPSRRSIQLFIFTVA